jgi:hypothetical protein
MSVATLTSHTNQQLIEQFAGEISRVNGAPVPEVIRQLERGLMPFLAAADAHPGRLYPGPLVFELMDHVRCYGPHSMQERLRKIQIADPQTDAEALATYTETLQTLKSAVLDLDASIWPAAQDFAARATTYK